MFCRAINISPLDGNSFPSVSMINEIGKDFEVGMNEDEFWQSVSMSISSIRERTATRRKIEIEKMKAKSKCR